jgi:uncharacterized membrane protein
METQESNNMHSYRARFWRTYLLLLIVSIIIATVIGIMTSSVIYGMLSYFAVNMILSMIVFYKFSGDQLKL